MKKRIKINYIRLIIVCIVFTILIYAVISNTKLKDKEVEISDTFPNEVYGITVNTRLIESETEARPGKKRKVRYIVIHETDNTSKGATASNHAEYLSKNNKTSTSWHYTVDEKEIYHHVPDEEVAHHAATQEGNQYGIGIELCVNEEGDFEKTFENASKLVAYLLKEYWLTTKSIKTHNDFSGKYCPHNILKNDRMDEFVKKVKSYMQK